LPSNHVLMGLWKGLKMEEKLLAEFRSLCIGYYIHAKESYRCPNYYRLQGARDLLDAVKINYQEIEKQFKLPKRF